MHRIVSSALEKAEKTESDGVKVRNQPDTLKH
jgi:hypothetical protein